MKCSAKSLIYLLAGLGLLAEARAAVNEAEPSPYAIIPRRNIFDLHEPKVVQTGPVEPPPLNIRLTGITTILGHKQAFLMVQAPAVAGKPAGKEESYIIGEGQREGAIEILEIDEKASTVRIKSEDKVSLLSFETVKLPNVSPTSPATFPGGPTPPAFMHRNPPPPPPLGRNL